MSNSPFPRPLASSKDPITNGGLGNLDISWLNSRNNKVEKEMEAELWAKAQDLVQTLSEVQAETDENSDVAMSNETTSNETPAPLL